ncbi:Anhydro-N-acetylmuramic acid kinase [Neolewinella maritima]|uniref:Anhydro-N-acetylmuramic acid kinase n=1 Tax=Neolewinella maritima TaxID=1383882 RepID=A0ABN8F4A9_9BACT|nr:anhydro-N-acetylmuramic acid kinase [Neolewinella maritima]CAH1001773.1 Anhydro-N-acetylmuramic acid kinase [Neolewinella maritima]
MSGSSLDGLDLACCSFTLAARPPLHIADWSIDAATTIAYPPEWKERLRQATTLTTPQTCELHAALGTYIGQQAATFLTQHPELRPTLVGCHGHTTHHDPAQGYSIQLGDGAHIARQLQLPVVTELRSADIAAGGQGAPLAPVADRYLFPTHQAFLNLGGIANFSIRTAGDQFVAGDVTGCCQILDRLAAERGLAYDAGGALARSGNWLPQLADSLDTLPYHRQPYPKSLSNQWVVQQLWPLVRDTQASVPDRLHTFTTWLARTIAHDLLQVSAGAAAGAQQLLVSGGGARNTFLVDQLTAALQPMRVAVADGLAGDYKEAALIALCALLRQQGLPNSLASATGARHDTINGALHAA